MKTYTESAKIIPVIAETEVLVVGGGPAGIGTALGAARAGVKVMLLEQSNALGGMATNGLMSHWSPGSESPLLDEIMKRACDFESLPLEPNERFSWCISHECLKTTLLEIMNESGVTIQLYTQTVDVIMDENKICGVITESKSGREAIMAKVVVDATGDGDIAAKSGAEFILGREEDNCCQPVTLMFRIGGVDYSKAIFPYGFECEIEVPKGEIQALGKAILPYPSGHVLLYKTRFPGEVCVNMTNVIDVDATDVRQLTKAEVVCRKQIEEIIPFLRNYAPGYENCYLLTTAQNVGVRETRHFKGLYTLTSEDILEAKVFDDWIATKNYFNFDIHNLKGPGLDRNGVQKHFESKGKYTIPYRACIPAKIDSLLLSGRNISGTHKAHSNFRVMPICLNIGQGVGIAAAIAVQKDIIPRDVNVNEIQNILNEQGITI